MPILDNEIVVKWNNSNKKHYIEKGYIFTSTGKEFIVKLDDVTSGCTTLIKCQCDYCGEITYRSIKDLRKSLIITNKIACKNCKYKKVKESNMQKFGVENVFQSDIIKDKIKETLANNYGEGIINPGQAKEVREKVKQTCIEKYGVDSHLKLPETWDKIKKTNLEKYGVEHLMQIKEISQERSIKGRNTMYKNNTAPVSKPQRHLHNLLGGELNYAIGNCWLDIAFPQDMIYIEYDGSGHNLCVKLGHISENEFKQKEIRRQYYLQSLGWKLIRITCKNDKLPSDEIILKTIDEAKEYLKNTMHNHIIIKLGEVINEEIN